MDVRAALARENHRLAGQDEAAARAHRDQRDAIVRQLRAEDRYAWTLSALARDIGCSKELIAHILRTAPAEEDETV